MYGKGYNTRTPWGLALRQSKILTAEGTVVEVTTDGLTDLLAQEPEPRRPEGFIHRASTRVRSDGSDEFGPINVPRRRGDGFMEYRVFPRVQRYKLADGTEAQAISRRSDAWAKARSPEAGMRRLALLQMARADVLGDKAPARGVGNGVQQDTLAHGRSHSSMARFVRGLEGRVLSDAEMMLDCIVTYNGKRYAFRMHRETGEVRGFAQV